MNLDPILPPDNTGKTYKTHKTSNPKADAFKQYFLSPTSGTFMNVRGSAIRAGYSELYAENITVQQPKWWVELQKSAEFNRAHMLREAEKGLMTAVTYEDGDKDRENMRLKASIFVSERLGKEFYSARQELTGADGRRLFASETRQSQKIPLTSLFKGVKKGA